MDESNILTKTKIDLEYSEEKVHFSICDCSLNKKYSFWSLNREQAKKFIEKLKHIEKMKWKELAACPRETGLTPERHDSGNFKMIDEQNTYAAKLTEQHYFHFRVERTGLFRVFGYQKHQFFYITHIDPRGRGKPLKIKVIATAAVSGGGHGY